jgi:hypothetical protein
MLLTTISLAASVISPRIEPPRLNMLTPFNDKILAELKKMEFVTIIELVLKSVIVTACVLRVLATIFLVERRLAVRRLLGAISLPFCPILDIDQ